MRDTGLLMYAPDGLLGCRLGHEALVRSARILAEQRLPLAPDDRLFDPRPPAELGTLQAFNACLAAGAAFVGLPAFDAAAAARVLAAERCTVAFPGAGSAWAAIVAESDGLDLSALWLVAADAEPEALEATADRTPDAAHACAYAVTEAAGVIALGELDGPPGQRVASAGRPFFGIEVRIADPETGEELPAGQRGRIAIRGWSLFEGHHRRPADHLDADGFLVTADEGTLDASGRLFLGDVALVR